MEKDILEVVCQQIIESSEGLSVALEKCLSMANDSPEFLEAIEEYTNKVQEIWDVAELAGLNGLLDVCTFINDNLMAFLIQDDTTQALHYFEQWPLKVLEYLQSPDTNASELIAFMQESAWPMPLDSEAASYLLKLLASEDVEEEKPHNELKPLEFPEFKDISLGSSEVIDALCQEIESIQNDLQQALDSIDEYNDLMQRLYMASEMLEMKGLQSICLFIISNVTFLLDATVAERKQVTILLEKWPKFVLDYFRAPADNIISLVNYLRDTTWVHPLTDDDAYTLLNQLTSSSAINQADEEVVKRQTKAELDDVSLAIPSDINSELLEAYLEETPQLTVEFSESIQSIIDNYNLDEIRRAQRLAHTLKGSSNIIGIKGIANIAHNLEDILVYFAEHNTKPPKNLTDTLVESADCLALMVETLLGQNQEEPQLALNILQTLLDWANNIDKGKIEAPTASASAPTIPTSTQQVTEEIQPVLRVRTKTIDELMRLVGELSISTKQIQERLKHILLNTHRLTEQNSQVQKKSFELEHLVDVRCITNVFHNINKIENIKGFDPLEFEAYNELHSITHGFIETIADNRELTLSINDELEDLESIVIEQERLNKDFQTNLMTTRMVPAKNLITKLKRNIRQTSRTTGKEVELEVIGTDILIDSDILNNLADPLQHILRNAIDHGLEAPEQRKNSGKSATGLIQLSFYREGNNIVVKCQDDGQGLNYPKIHATALERGLINEHQELTEQELARLILMSGFSTKSDVTQMSGRGIGMDVVHTNIREMKGTLDLSSETGKGTTILMKLPMSLVTVHVLLVRVANQRFAIPSNYLELAIAPNVGTLQGIGEEIHFRLEKDIYALRNLANLLNISRGKLVQEQAEKYPIILVREETGVTAVLVDEVLDTQDLVMKRMGKYVNNIHGVTGAAILGDGSIVPLLDLPELLRSSLSAAISSPYTTSQHNQTTVESSSIETPRVMIVDDSLSVRKSLSITMEKAGFDTLLAKDGIEAIEIMKNTMPTIMLVDMEMPRMNGLELSKYVRAQEQTKNLPIFMITSRTTEKHREQAKLVGIDHYFTKPYDDNNLLEMIENAI